MDIGLEDYPDTTACLVRACVRVCVTVCVCVWGGCGGVREDGKTLAPSGVSSCNLQTMWVRLKAMKATVRTIHHKGRIGSIVLNLILLSTSKTNV